MRKAAFLSCMLLVTSTKCCHRKEYNQPLPAKPVQDVSYDVLDARQQSLFMTYPGVNATNARDAWTKTLNLSQRVEFAGGLQAIEKIEQANKWQVIATVTKIHGSEPSAPSEQQFNNEVVWNKDAETHFEGLPCWSEHIALLHPGQHGYQENRDENPFLGMVVLFDDAPHDPNRPGGQLHIDFRSFFSHYFPENGDIGNSENYVLYKKWYGYIDSFVPQP